MVEKISSSPVETVKFMCMDGQLIELSQSTFLKSGSLIRDYIEGGKDFKE